ncbi:hypothetical protein ACFL0X_02920, partial [Nanoarchaeota archaeon]
MDKKLVIISLSLFGFLTLFLITASWFFVDKVNEERVGLSPGEEELSACELNSYFCGFCDQNDQVDYGGCGFFSCCKCSSDGGCENFYESKPVCDTGSGKCVECIVNSDCSTGEICEDNVCEEVECIVNSDCSTGEICEDNVCEEVPPGCVPDCLDKNCGGDGCGGSCGICEDEWKCSENGNCVYNLNCLDTCDFLDYGCGTHTICDVSVNCGTCSSGYFCNETYTCVVLGSECTSDSDCDSGEECLGGECVDEDNGGSSSGGGDSDAIDIVIYSPQNITYGSTSILLKVGDLNENARYWKYSLNGGSRVSFVPNATLNADLGSNILKIYAKQNSNSIDYVKQVIFSVVVSGVGSFCGDGVCDSNEGCSDCSLDCGVCEVSEFCGDSICGDYESGFSCPEDCGGVSESDSDWLFYFVIFLIVFIFLVVVYLIIRGIRKFRSKQESNTNFKKPFNKINKPVQKQFRKPLVSSEVSKPVQKQVSRPIQKIVRKPIRQFPISRKVINLRELDKYILENLKKGYNKESLR